MTAEVALMNRMGVALAADSAVTLGDSQKTYASAEKLFQLSENAPVGIMVYGRASFMRVPWETVVKVYRATLKGKNLDSLQEYGEDFIAFLKQEEKLRPEVEQQTLATRLIAETLVVFRTIVQMRLEEALEEDDSLAEGDIKRIFAGSLDVFSKVVRSLPELDELPENFKEQLAQEYGAILASMKENFLGKLPRTKPSNDRLDDLVLEALVRVRFNDLGSGIVIAGYGAEEHFPSVLEFSIYGSLSGALLYNKGKGCEVGEASDAWILPFAQQEMVYAFMEGIDPQLRDTVQRSTEKLFQDAMEMILDHVKGKDVELSQKIRKDISDSLDVLLKSLFQEWAEERRGEFSEPVTQIVSVLPKDELAAMAESLVNLTKFKRRVSRQQETVSGPIDVAVITKGDGFVWIKRKHYFRPELNPRYLARIQQRGDRA